MDEKYIQDLFNQLGGESKFGKFDAFKYLISNDKKYRQDFYNAFGEKTLGAYNDFDELVKKNETSLLPSPPSEENTQLPSQQPAVEQEIPTISLTDAEVGIDPFEAAKEYKRLKEQQIFPSEQEMLSTRGAARPRPDEAKVQEANSLREQWKKDSGIDIEELYEETKDLTDTDFGTSGYSKRELIEDRKYNPSVYERKISRRKWRGGLEQKLSGILDGSEQKKAEYDSVLGLVSASLKGIDENNDFDAKRDNVKTIVKTIENYAGEDKDKIIENFATEISKAYGNAYKSNFDKVYSSMPESKYLDKDAALAYQYLKDISPEKAKQYERLFIDKAELTGDENAIKGYNELMLNLQETGIALQKQAVSEDIRNYERIAEKNGGLSESQIADAEQLEKRLEELSQKQELLNDQYPQKRIDLAEDAVTEILGPSLNFVRRKLGEGGKGIANIGKGLWVAISKPFMSEKSNTIRELAIMGEMGEAERPYKLPSKSHGLITEELVIDKDFQPQVDAIVNDKTLDKDDKRLKLWQLFYENPDKYSKVPVKNGKLNINPSSIAEGVASLATTLYPFMVTGGIGGASTAGRLMSTLTTGFAVSFYDNYAAAIKQGKSQSEAYKMAMVNSAIDGAVIAGAGTVEKVRAMYAGAKTSAAKVLEKMSDDYIQKIIDRGVSKGLKVIQNQVKERVKSVPGQFAKGLKGGAEFEVARVAGEGVKSVIGETEFNPKEQAKQAILGTLNFALAGPVFGQLGFKTTNQLDRANILSIARQPKEFQLANEKLLKDGVFTQEQYEQRKELIEKASDVYKSVIQKAKVDLTLTENKLANYLLNSVVKSENLKAKDGLPPKQAKEAEKNALVADYKNQFILDELTKEDLQKRQAKIEKELEPKKDSEGNVVELNEKQKANLEAELQAVKESIEEAGLIGAEETSKPIELSTEIGELYPKAKPQQAPAEIVDMETQVKDFGVSEDMAKPVTSVVNRVFEWLKKAGLTAAKSASEWVGIGKGGVEKPYTLKMNGKDVQVRNVQPEVVNGFYSPLEKTIGETKFDKLPAKQWVDKFGKSEEAKWTGLTDWLNQQQGSVSKVDIQQYLKDNRIQVVEVVKSDRPFKEIKNKMFSLGNDWEEVYGGVEAKKSNKDGDRFNLRINGVEYQRDFSYPDAKSYIEANADVNPEKNRSKFSQYQLEGQKENYKEVLVTMPNNSKYQNELNRLSKKYNAEPNYKSLRESEATDSELEFLRGLNTENFKSSHFDEPNILVHLRMNTRVDADGNKVLFIEELQSDFGQSYKKEQGSKSAIIYDIAKDIYFGKKRGDKAQFENATKKAKDKGITEQEVADALNEYGDFTKARPAEIPSAPFITDTNAWTKLGLKVALKEAVAQGADKIAWTTGEQQIDRYDLSKQVDYITKHNESRVNKEDNSIDITISVNNGLMGLVVDKTTGKIKSQNGSSQFENLKGKGLDEVIGKDIADRILKMDEAEYKLQGEGLKVGGKGMKGFYGSPTEGSLGIVGNVAKSLFKQEPKTVEINKDKNANEFEIKKSKLSGKWMATDHDQILKEFDTEEQAKQFVKDKTITTQHSIDITPELKASVEGGQPLFKDAEAQYRIESGKNIIEAIKEFDGSPKATVSLTHEIMHPTVVAIIDGAKEGNEVGQKHTETIVNEYNKATGQKLSTEDLIKGNDDFKNGTTSKQYRAVQEFIAKSWEKYHKEGGKGFSAEFQKVLDQITKAFQSVYKSLTGKQLTPELRKMFDEILGKEEVKAEPPSGGEPPVNVAFVYEGSKQQRERAVLTHLLEAKNIPESYKENIRGKEGLKYNVANMVEAAKVGEGVVKELGVDAALEVADSRMVHPSVGSAIFAESLNTLHAQEIAAREAGNTAEAVALAQKWADVSLRYAEEATAGGQFNAQIAHFYKSSPMGIVMRQKVENAKKFDEWFESKEENYKEILKEFLKTEEGQTLLKEEVEKVRKEERAKERAARKERVYKKIDDAVKKWADKLTPKTTKGVEKQGIGTEEILKALGETMKKAYEVGEAIEKIIEDARAYLKEKLNLEEAQINDVVKDFAENLKEKDIDLEAKYRTKIEELERRIREKDFEAEKYKEKKTLSEKEQAAKDELDEVRKKYNEAKKQAPEYIEKRAKEFVERFRKKMKGLNDKQKEELIKKSVKKLIDSGALEFEDFRKIIAEVLGYKDFTPEDIKKIEQLTETINKYGEIEDKMVANPTKESIKEAQIAQQENLKAQMELYLMTSTKADIIQTLKAIYTGNLLSVPTLIKNVGQNVIAQATVRFPKEIVKQLADLGAYGIAAMKTKWVGGEPPALPARNLFLAQKGYFGGGYEGIGAAAFDFAKGVVRKDYFAPKEYQSTLSPRSALKELKLWQKGELALTNEEVADKMIRSTLGWQADFILRSMAFGDTVFRYSAEHSKAIQIAIQELGLERGSLGVEAFLKSPRKYAYKVFKEQGKTDKEASELAAEVEQSIIREGERAVFQEENLLSRMSAGAEQKLKVSKEDSPQTKFAKRGGSLLKTKIFPFVKIPANVYWSFFKAANPYFTMALSMKDAYLAVKARKEGKLAEARKFQELSMDNVAHAIVGYGMITMADYWIQQGLIRASNPSDTAKKEREAEKLFGKQNQLNLGRLMGGGDWWVDLSWFGALGTVMDTRARMQEDKKRYELTHKEEEKSWVENGMDNVMYSAAAALNNLVFDQASRFASAITGSESQRESYYRESLGSIQNMFTGGTLPAISKAMLPYEARVKGDNIWQTLNNDLKYRNGLYRLIAGNPPAKVSIWGEPIKKEAGLKNVVFNMLGFESQKGEGVFGLILYDDFNRTQNRGFFPPVEDNEITVNGKKVKITETELADLQTMVGQARKSLVEPYVSDMGDRRFVYSNSTDKQKLSKLARAYRNGRTIGYRAFREKYPQYKDIDVPEADQSNDETE